MSDLLCLGAREENEELPLLLLIISPAENPSSFFTRGSGPELEYLDCLYSGADEEIFGRLQHIPAKGSVPGSREEQH